MGRLGTIKTFAKRDGMATLPPRAGLRLALAFLGLWLTLPLAGQAPPGYYDPAAGLEGDELRQALHNIIDDHDVVSFAGTRFAIDVLQQDPGDSNNVILIYSGFSVPKSSWPEYNREHAWPVSLGATDGTPAHTDLFALYGCDADVNSTRSNKFYDNCFSGCSIPDEAPECRYDGDSWEPRDEDKGDLARALFYMDVRYEGDTAGEPDLVLGDSAPFVGCDCMARLQVLRQWHEQDPPDAWEMQRNDLIFTLYQGNRNPFVDHPEWVAALYDGGGGGPSGEAWVNEFHYDNFGIDVDEGVEVAGVAGTSLAGWTVVAYDGGTGEDYDTIALGGVVPDQSGGFGARWFPFPDLQNGPDGLALVNPSGDVVQFVSYEGSFQATTGPAVGLIAQDVVVFEPSTSPEDESLQLQGSGSGGDDFFWAGPVTSSRGLLNPGQTFPSGDPGFRRGDCNDDGLVNIGDPIRALEALFAGAPPVGCERACDANGDGLFDVGDAVYLLSFLFTPGSPPPPAPFPGCAAASGALPCGEFTACP